MLRDTPEDEVAVLASLKWWECCISPPTFPDKVMLSCNGSGHESVPSLLDCWPCSASGWTCARFIRWRFVDPMRVESQDSRLHLLPTRGHALTM